MCSAAHFYEHFRVGTALALVLGIPVIPRIPLLNDLNPLFRSDESDPPSSAALWFSQ